MNYTWTVSAMVGTINPYAQFWTLDCSQSEWRCLDERCLSEPAGLFGRNCLHTRRLDRRQGDYFLSD